MTQTDRSHLREVALVFLRFGIIGFGGPAAHIGLFHEELVKRRKWLDDQEFLDLLGATNLIPGPNSTEMAIHIGYTRAGWPGLIVGGACFILPAVVIVLLLAAMYVAYGATPQAAWVLYGVKPVIIVVVAQALWSLGRRAVRGWLLALVGALTLVLAALSVNEIMVLAVGGVLVMLFRNAGRLRQSHIGALLFPLAGWGLWQEMAPFSLSQLFLTFLKIGSLLYGSGYVLLAFMRNDFVSRLHWLTDAQLIDAIAIGLVTPGPVFTTATFVGYLLGGVPAALVATLGIFLPSFIFVALTHPFIPRMRQSRWLGALLDGVAVASLSLMAVVAWVLSRSTFVDLYSLLAAAVAAVLLFRFKVNTTWLIVGGPCLDY
ncbi:MAG: chromate efflux transporter [Anaerolineae bacterium]|nr:MAG: chromate efflux transporter [Anaerolineae bacterium]